MMKTNNNLTVIDRTYILTSSLQDAITLLNECITNPVEKKDADSMVIYGDSRSGKTALIKHFMSIRSEKILYCEMPVPATIKGLISIFLDNLGDPFAFTKRGSIHELTMRLESLIKKSNVRMIVLDESQHLVESQHYKLIMETSDWFKNVINRLNVPVIFLGLEHSENIFTQNIQLSRRIFFEHKIIPMSFQSKEFQYTILEYNDLLSYPLPNDLLGNENLVRIHATTKGYHGFIKRLFFEIEKLSKENLMTTDLETIVNKCFSRHLAENPFSNTFDTANYYKFTR